MLLDYKWPDHEYSDEEEKASKIDNVSVSELQSILMIDCNLAVWRMESKYLKITDAFWTIKFENCSKFI